MPSPRSASRLALHPPLLRSATRRSSGGGFGTYAVRMSGDRPSDHLPSWLVLDSRGRIVARAHSELLAIAKMKILVLAELATPRQSI